jgi:F-type H+-transporting ATPase subunit b
LKRSSGIASFVFLLILSLAILPGSFAFGQTATETQPAPATSPTAAAPAPPEGDATTVQAVHQEEHKEESESQEEQFLHSPVVQKLAGILHLPVETTANICRFINFALLALSILYFVFKLVPKYFRSRKDAIQKQLVDARSATEVANERLKGVEERLSRLDQDIDAIRKQVEQDASQDETRIKASLEEERVRIVDSAGHEIEAAAAAAQRELKRFAAELAINRAAGQLQLTPETDRKLVKNFASSLGNSKDGGRN